MALIAEFALRSERLPLTGVTATAPDVVVRVDDVLTPADSRPVLVFWIEGEALDAFDTALADDPSVASASVLGTTGRRRLYRVELTEQPPPIYTEFVRLDTAPINATITANGWRARTRFVDREALAAFAASCDTYDVDFRLEEVFEATPAADAYGLTPKQRETLLVAHEAGYFDVPRTTSLADLGAELGVSAPSVSERLRRAEDRLIRRTLRLNDRD